MRLRAVADELAYDDYVRSNHRPAADVPRPFQSGMGVDWRLAAVTHAVVAALQFGLATSLWWATTNYLV